MTNNVGTARSGKLDLYERVHAEDRDAWRRWLDEHHGDSPGIWLVSWKAATGKPRMTYDEVVKEALCFGWVLSISDFVMVSGP